VCYCPWQAFTEYSQVQSTPVVQWNTSLQLSTPSPTLSIKLSTSWTSDIECNPTAEICTSLIAKVAKLTWLFQTTFCRFTVGLLRPSDSWSKGRRFDSQPGRYQVQNAAARLVTGARRWLHDAHSTPIALATSTPANYLQDGCAGIQMSAWHSSAIHVPVDILRANVIAQRSASPALCWVRPTHCFSSTYEDNLRRAQFCGLRTSRVEQPSSRTPSAGHFTPSVQETTENVPVIG